jgi:hypothetical protein
LAAVLVASLARAVGIGFTVLHMVPSKRSTTELICTLVLALFATVTVVDHDL